VQDGDETIIVHRSGSLAERSRIGLANAAAIISNSWSLFSLVFVGSSWELERRDLMGKETIRDVRGDV